MTLAAVKSTSKSNENHNQSDSYKTSSNPLKNRSFFAIPRQIALTPGVSDRLYRLLSILFSSFGADGHIEYKIKTLSMLLQKGERQTMDLVELAKKDGWITTKQTGRSLIFFLTEKCYEGGPKNVQKSADQSCGFPQVSYKELKETIKKKKQSSGGENPPAGNVQAAPPLQGGGLVSTALSATLKKYFGDQAPELISKTFGNDSIKDPIGYLCGCIRKKRSDSLPRQSLTKPLSFRTPPINPGLTTALKEQQDYDQDLQEYRRQDMFMQQGKRPEEKRELSDKARRLMARMEKNFNVGTNF